jgi:hypothetical protein
VINYISFEKWQKQSIATARELNIEIETTQACDCDCPNCDGHVEVCDVASNLTDDILRAYFDRYRYSEEVKKSLIKLDSWIGKPLGYTLFSLGLMPYQLLSGRTIMCSGVID